MNRPERVLICAGFPPHGGWGGGVIVRSLLSAFRDEDVCWLEYCGQSPDLQFRPGIRRESFHWVFRGQRFLGSIWESLEGYRFLRRVNRLVREHDARWVWIIVDAGLILVTHKYARRIKAPVHISVHDHPTLLVPERSKNAMDVRFGALLVSAASIDCISDRLARRLHEEHRVAPVVITRGVKSHSRRRSLNVREGGLLHIVMGGSGYLPPPWPHNVLEALESVEAETGIAIAWHVFDERHGHVNHRILQVHAPLREAEFDDFMDGMHLGYACDPMDDAGREFARTSLSTKVITYLGAGLPFLYHGPADSTVSDLLSNYKAGMIVESMNSAVIAAVIMQLINSYEDFASECVRSVSEMFDRDLVQRKFIEGVAIG